MPQTPDLPDPGGGVTAPNPPPTPPPGFLGGFLSGNPYAAVYGSGRPIYARRVYPRGHQQPEPLMLQGQSAPMQPYQFGGNVGTVGGLGGGLSPGLPAGAMTPRAEGTGAGYYGGGTPNWFYDPNWNFSPRQGIASIIPYFWSQGAFNAQGQGGYLDAIKAMLMEQENADVRKAQLGADLYAGEDPMAAVYGRLQAEQAARDRYPAIIAQAQAQAAARREQNVYGLLREYFGVQTRPGQPGTDWGAVAGNVVGTAGGALLPGLLGL